MFSRVETLSAWLLALAVAVSGCGQDNPLGRQAVSGEVSLKGQPLDNGMIRFAPAETTATTSSGAIITNGTYSIPEDKGLPPGTYNVQISAPEGGVATEELPGDSTQVFAKERVPPDYNSESKHTVEVKAGAENKFDFRIE